MSDYEVSRAPYRLSRSDRTTEILVAARKILARKGYENFVTQDVAEALQISEGTIYRYFPTKRDLIIRVAEDWFAEIMADEPGHPAMRGTLERLKHFIARCLAIVRKEPSLTRFILLELRSDPAYRSMRVFELNRRFTSKVTEVLRDAVASGEIRDDVPLPLLRDMVFGCIEHQTWAYLRGEGDFSTGDVTDGIARVIYRGMATQAALLGEEIAASLAKLDEVAQSLRRIQG